MLENWPGKRDSKINTVDGEAIYYGTEVEVNGRWDDSYSTRDGFWVIHSGRVE